MSKMRRKQLIIKLLRRENKRQRKENKQLHDKHWNECRQIALYDDEVRKAKGGATLRDYVRMSYGKYKASLYVQTWTLRGKVIK